ncbi:flagellar biosynthetic protein FliO [Pseudoalteromonas sp. BDTF-M6]|uniref:flagellar biosynthetic protein FliO n=1 Tax=Pseudoalteromonas sp. BDTF-M6 TaxID=2796132 RepID=UPI001BAED95B|nr:flagellar biosynthetic protein FliO [Pseudoalteromonas sp. BDTF-M6]MBS3798817.1 flagellar biosynthetic protein FliO [Pseudoalteromonas sp. BDTF-M6]
MKLARIALLLSAAAPTWGWASTAAATPGAGLNLNIVSMLLSLMLVVVTILVLAFLLKRFNPNMATSDDFKVVRTLALGTKERLLVVEIDNKQHLLGVTPQAINYLYELENPLPEREMTPLAKQLSHLLNTKNKT